MQITTVLSPKFTLLGVQKDYRGMFMQRMRAALVAAIDPVIRDIIYATESRNARENYKVEYLLAGDAVQARISNAWPYWIFQEYNTSNYSRMPPHSEGTRLYDYIMYENPRSDPNPFLAARAILQRGTRGKYTFTDHWNYALPMIESKLQLAAAQFVAEASGFSEVM